MNLIQETIMPYNSGKSFVVKKKQRIRITSETVIDFVAFNLDNLRERFCQARTKVHNNKIYISVGNQIYSKFSNIMMTIVEDTYKGHHDLQYAGCSQFANDRIYSQIIEGNPTTVKCFENYHLTKREDLPLRGCWENLYDGLKGYDINFEDVPATFNLFQNVEIGQKGELIWKLDECRPKSGEPDYIDLRAEMNCLVALSVCPSYGTLPKPIKVQIFEE